jgi:hypothetical protein
MTADEASSALGREMDRLLAGEFVRDDGFTSPWLQKLLLNADRAL